MIVVFFSSSFSPSAFSFSLSFWVSASTASGAFSWFHGSFVESSKVSILARPALPPGPLPNSMSSVRGVLRNLFMIPEKLGKLIEANGLNLVSVFLSSAAGTVSSVKWGLMDLIVWNEFYDYLSSRHYLKPQRLVSRDLLVLLQVHSSWRKGFATWLR